MHIIDNFLPANEFDRMHRAVLSEEFPWFYSETVSILPEENHVVDPMAIETDGLHHIIYDREANVESFTYKWLDVFMTRLEDELGYTREHLIRARLSQKTPRVGFTSENYNIPHVDYPRPHDVLIFYLNDSDGDTWFFNQRFTVLDRPVLFTTEQRVSPKANRLLAFNGLRYHTASNPINTNRRVILNINLEPL